jgi:hypothetical protein
VASQFNTTPEALLQTTKVYDAVLKFPTLLQPNTTAYTFNPVKAVDTPVPGEIKIDKNDFFAVTGVGIRFTRAQFASSSGTNSNYGNYEEYLYPNTQVFNGAAQAGSGGKTEAQCLYTIIRGALGLSVNNDQQWNIAVSELVSRQINFASNADAINWGPGSEGRGIFPLNSIIILDGNSDNQLNLALLPGDTNNINGQYDTNGVATTTHRNFIMPVLYGVLLKNAAGGAYTLQNCRA